MYRNFLQTPWHCGVILRCKIVWFDYADHTCAINKRAIVLGPECKTHITPTSLESTFWGRTHWKWEVGICKLKLSYNKVQPHTCLAPLFSMIINNSGCAGMRKYPSKLPASSGHCKHVGGHPSGLLVFDVWERTTQADAAHNTRHVCASVACRRDHITHTHTHSMRQELVVVGTRCTFR